MQEVAEEEDVDADDEVVEDVQPGGGDDESKEDAETEAAPGVICQFFTFLNNTCR